MTYASLPRQLFLFPFFELTPQRNTAHTKCLCGGGFVAACGFQCGKDTLQTVFGLRCGRKHRRLGRNTRGMAGEERRQIVCIEGVAIIAQHAQPLAEVAQFTDVTLPVLLLETVCSSGSQLKRMAVLGNAEFIQKGAGEHGNVTATLAQRRNGQVEHIQPVIQILSEFSFAHLLV